MPKLVSKLYAHGLCGLALFLFSYAGVSAQSKQSDLTLIETTSTVAHHHIVPKKPLQPVLKYNPLFWVLNGSLTFYQKVISPQISAGCLYETSCSRFSRKALHEFGLLKGVVLTADRLSRCNRITAAAINRDRLNADGLVVDEPSMYRFK